MSSLSLRNIQGITTYNNEIVLPSGNTLHLDGEMEIPVWTDATRPSSPQVGSLGYNSDINSIEYYTGSTWEKSSLTNVPSISLTNPNAISGTTEFISRNATVSTNSAMFGQWPQKHLGRYELRGYTAGGQAGGQYLHLRTTIPCGSNMTFIRAEGYLYNNANIWGRAGFYPYNGTVINIHINNSGSSLIDGIYPSNGGGGSNNKACIRFNRNSTGYSEGRFDLWLSGHSDGQYAGYEVDGIVYTDSNSNQF